MTNLEIIKKAKQIANLPHSDFGFFRHLIVTENTIVCKFTSEEITVDDFFMMPISEWEDFFNRRHLSRIEYYREQDKRQEEKDYELYLTLKKRFKNRDKK